MKDYADRELEDLVRAAFAEMMPRVLDESNPRKVVESPSEEPVPSAVVMREASGDSDRPRVRILVGAAVIALVVTGLAVIGRNAVSNDSTSSPASVKATETVPTVGTTDVSTAVPATAISVTAVPTTATTNDEWHQQPQRRFSLPVGYLRPFSDARELVIRRCMNASGFEYTLRPNFADMPSDGSGWPAGDQWDEWHRQQAATVRGFKVAYFGPAEIGGGCLDQAYATIYGPVRAEVYAENIRSSAQSLWIRTALTDPGVLAALQPFADCARAHGVSVADAAVDPQQAQEDLAAFDVLLPQVDPDAYTSPTDYFAAIRAEADKICPTYGIYHDQRADATRLATVAWIEANPDTMTDIQREVDEDLRRFDWIIAHDGELPPN